MELPPTLLSDAPYQSALRALLQIGAVPRELGADTALLVLGLHHVAVLYRADAHAEVEAISTSARAFLDDNPALTVDVVLAGGDLAWRTAVSGALPPLSPERSVGVAQLPREGAAAFSGFVNPRVKTALTEASVELVSAEALSAALTQAIARGVAMRAEIEKFSTRLQQGRPWVTYVSAGVLVGLFALQSAWGGSLGVQVREGAFVSSRVLHGELYRLLSYALLHANVTHVAFNTMTLVSLGSFYEKLLGGGRFLTLLVLASLGGALACLASGSAAVMVGASGALWGLLGVSAALALRPGDTLPEPMRPAFRKNAISNVVIQAAISLAPGISLATHLGGGVVGFALMMLGAFRPPSRPADAAMEAPTTSAGWRRAAVLSAAVMVGASGFAMAKGRPWAYGHERLTLTALPGTPLRMQLPAAPEVVARTDETREFTSGSLLSDAYMVGVRYVTVDHPLDDAEQRRIMEEMIVQPGGAIQNAGTHIVRPPVIIEEEGVPMIQQRSEVGAIEIDQVLRIRASDMIIVEVAVPREKALTAPHAAALLRSVRPR